LTAAQCSATAQIIEAVVRYRGCCTYTNELN
jgi:hypothetical protein